MRLKNLQWLWLSIIIIIVDQVTKILIRHHLPLGHYHVVTSYFNLVHARNYGAAFSFMDTAGGHQRWVFSVFSLLVSILLIIWLLNLQATAHWRAAGLALVIGGALGNFWGRFTSGYVTDFLDFHWHTAHWPAFNVADSAVCVGAAILILSLARGKK
jgi:signal peptidase II